jgi:hypothetical protein
MPGYLTSLCGSASSYWRRPSDELDRSIDYAQFSRQQLM